MRFISGREFACQRPTWYRRALRAVLMMAGGLLALGTALGSPVCVVRTSQGTVGPSPGR